MNELAIINSGEFRAVAVIGDTGENLMELLQENVGEQISVFDFAKLTVPSGGGEFWSIPSADGARVEFLCDLVIDVNWGHVHDAIRCHAGQCRFKNFFLDNLCD